MRTSESTISERLARFVCVRDIQRRFALTWDYDKDGPSETKLIQHYLRQVGAASLMPVLLTASLHHDSLGDFSRVYGVWDPALIIPQCLDDGGIQH